MFYIVQLCCFDCNKFISSIICYSYDYVSFIKFYYEDYSLYSYIVYDSALNEIIRFDGSELKKI